MTFDSRILYDNIAFLLKEKGIKVGEFETKAGVSVGYISRSIKDSSTKPSIDFLMNVADRFQISLDVLLGENLSELTQPKRYVLAFFQKLINDTQANKLDWTKENLSSFLEKNAYNTNVKHPFFEFEILLIHEMGRMSPTQTLCAKFKGSNNCSISKDCYYLNMVGGARLYLVLNEASDNTLLPPIKEVWLTSPNEIAQCLAGNDQFEKTVEALFTVVEKAIKMDRVKNVYRNIIDAYINDNALSDYDV